MLETLGGLPTHPLVVHLPVVLVPLATIGVVLMVIFPKLQQRLGVAVAAIAGVGFLGALLAVGSGEELESSLRRAGETISGTTCLVRSSSRRPRASHPLPAVEDLRSGVNQA